MAAMKAKFLASYAWTGYKYEFIYVACPGYVTQPSLVLEWKIVWQEEQQAIKFF